MKQSAIAEAATDNKDWTILTLIREDGDELALEKIEALIKQYARDANWHQIMNPQVAPWHHRGLISYWYKGIRCLPVIGQAQRAFDLMISIGAICDKRKERIGFCAPPSCLFEELLDTMLHNIIAAVPSEDKQVHDLWRTFVNIAHHKELGRWLPNGQTLAGIINKQFTTEKLNLKKLEWFFQIYKGLFIQKQRFQQTVGQDPILHRILLCLIHGNNATSQALLCETLLRVKIMLPTGSIPQCVEPVVFATMNTFLNAVTRICQFGEAMVSLGASLAELQNPLQGFIRLDVNQDYQNARLEVIKITYDPYSSARGNVKVQEKNATKAYNRIVGVLQDWATTHGISHTTIQFEFTIFGPNPEDETTKTLTTHI